MRRCHCFEKAWVERLPGSKLRELAEEGIDLLHF